MLIDFRTLFPKYDIKPKGVLHIGACLAEEAPIYDELGIFKQIWIEGNPGIFDNLKQNISHNPQAVAFNHVIGDENKPVTFHVANNGSQSSSVLQLGTHKKKHPSVHYVGDIETTMHRIDSLELDLSDVDFLNIDLQGAEIMALKGMGDLLNGFNWVYLEVNKQYLYIGCPLIEEIDRYLSKFGLKRVETKWAGNTGWGDALYIKK